jgi:hypothetical protein
MIFKIKWSAVAITAIYSPAQIFFSKGLKALNLSSSLVRFCTVAGLQFNDAVYTLHISQYRAYTGCSWPIYLFLNITQIYRLPWSPLCMSFAITIHDFSYIKRFTDSRILGIGYSYQLYARARRLFYVHTIAYICAST